MERSQLPLLQSAYKLDIANLHSPLSWSKKVKDMLDNLGFSYLWLAQNPALVREAWGEIYSRLIDQHRQDDLGVIETTNKHPHYKFLNEPGGAPSYWSHNLPFAINRFLAQTRIAGIPLGWHGRRVLDLSLVRECLLCRCVMRPKLTLYHLSFECDGTLLSLPKILNFMVDPQFEEFTEWLKSLNKQEAIALYNNAQKVMMFLQDFLIPPCG